ncbi:flagellar biosynthetic protein FliR [Govanella unica]|uniref:Flagellar biosynthetic protein FliR n=1 Tax=Govanella unica TaxID=2975056 RepID=A0A9X3TWF7_9PROT|nr:flagellar biosynthetic protein FliR [Govania unica]MDA5193235.1 flagellar biosynthetic protein FliR [Govania unica]
MPNLAQFTSAELFAFLLVFARIGSMVMIMPAFGETSIPAQIRLALALTLSLVILPLVRTKLPAMPQQVFMLFLLLFGEIVIGLAVAGAIRLMISALHVAGVVMSTFTGLGAAMAFDPSQGSQGAILGTFLTLLGVLLIFVTDMHHMLIAVLRDSYDLMPSGAMPPSADLAKLAITTVSEAFKLGIEMSIPFILFGLVFNISLGLVARLMPQLQIFFIAMPLNLMLGFSILFMSISGSMLWFLQHFEGRLALLLK